MLHERSAHAAFRMQDACDSSYERTVRSLPVQDHLYPSPLQMETDQAAFQV